MRGQKTCAAHGGRAPAALAAAKRRLALQAAQADADRLLASTAQTGDPFDPFSALSRVALEAEALKDALAARVNALKEIRYAAPGAGTEQLRAEMAMFERSLDRVAKFSATLIGLDIEGKRLEIENRKASRVVAAVKQALEVVDLSEEDRVRFIEAFLAGIGRAGPAGSTVPGEAL